MTFITLDIDEPFRPCKFLEYAADCRFILETTGFDGIVSHDTVKVWDTRRGHHISFWLKKPISHQDHILLQALLGSDRKREAFNYRRIKNGKFRSYLFDAKITKDGSFVNTRNEILEGVWEEVFLLPQEEFDSQYLAIRKERYEKGERKNAANRTGTTKNKTSEAKKNFDDGIRETVSSPSGGISSRVTDSGILRYVGEEKNAAIPLRDGDSDTP